MATESLLSGEFEGLAEEFSREAASQEKSIVEMQNAPPERAKALSQDIGSKLGHMDSMLQDMVSKAETTRDRRKQADMKTRIKKLKASHQTLKSNFDRVSLRLGGAAAGPGRTGGSREEILRLNQMQNSSNDRLKKINRSLAETEAVGANTLSKMEGQSDRYAGVVGQLKDAGANIDQAGATNKRLWRGQQLDKLIYGFTILVLLGGAIFLVYFFINK